MEIIQVEEAIKIQKAAREYSDDSLARTCAYTDKHTAKKQTATIEAYICKDKNNSLKICNEKPYRNMVLECWNSGVSSITIPKEMFPAITWDTTPKKVKVIIELEEEV